MTGTILVGGYGVGAIASVALPPGTRTLRALIDWSFELLNQQECVVFRRLGTFVNGFTLEAAANVCRDKLDEPEVFDGARREIGQP